MGLFRNKKAISLFMLVMFVAMISIPSFAAVQPTVNISSEENDAVLQVAMDTNNSMPWSNFLILGIILILLFSVGLINFKRD